MANSANGTVNGGHGTAVASVAAGRITGVANAATIVPVKVLQCDATGFVSDVIAGLDWVLQQHYAAPSIPKVVNMSIFYYLPGTAPYCNGTPVAQNINGAELSGLEQVVQTLVANGVTVVVSANNQNQDARNVSPARLGYGNTAITGPHTITVGGSMLSSGVDRRWISSNPTYSCTNFDPASNWGPAVDIFAPAHDITAASINVPLSTAAPWGYRRVVDGRSGTSFAAPFVAGMAARYLLTAGGSTPQQVWQNIMNAATYDVMDSSTLNGSPNRFLYRSGTAVCKRRAVG